MNARRNRTPLLALPMAAWMILFTALPLIYIIVISFYQRNETWGISNILTLENYKRLFDPIYIKVFADSIGLAVQATILSLLVGYPFAYAMAKAKPKRRAALMLLVIIPFWTSSLMRIYGWMIMLQANGPINTLLLNLGIVARPAKLLFTHGAVLLGMVYTLLPFMILPCHTSIERLDARVTDAARDLGASPARAFITVTLPLTVPGILSGCMLVFVPTMGLYYVYDLLGGGKGAILGRVIHDQMMSARNPPFGAALSVALILLTGLVVALQRRLGGKDIGFF
ncbi:spermidine/putrescine ABC transporter permease [Clostridia bacterium]|nr:spermidine/putrescine ABC transporter permease [Clostridia bacterium]